MGLVKNTFSPVSTYNRIPFIHDIEHVAETYKDDLDYLKDLLDKHGIPPSACIKLIHFHFHLNEGEILAFSEFSAPPHGSWIELDYPGKRATFLLPSHVPLPQSDRLVQRTTKTQFLSAKNEMDRITHAHTEHCHSNDAESNEPIVDSVSTKDRLFLTGIPLDSGTASSV